MSRVIDRAAVRIVRNSNVVGIDLSMILQILPSLIGLFASCKKKPTPPTPPASVATDEQHAAWENSYGMKTRATEGWDGNAYSRSLLNHTIKGIRREKKSNGEKLTKGELESLAVASLDEARKMSHWDLYEATLEANQ